jgi:hypothetical protein
MIYRPPSPQNPDLLKSKMRETIKKILKEDPELLNGVIFELRNEKLKKIKDKLN